ncbi:MAG: hypothetical protein JO148_09835, partial [Acidimicrobiia bacterium]|nr:hypothetical protein [Acidimicrobiia bacterium]
MAAEVLGGAAVVLAVFAKVYGLHGLALAGVSLLLAASMLLVIQAPGGSVPVGYALVIALAELQSASTFFPVLGLGLVATVPVLLVRSGQSETLRCLLRWAAAGCACGGAAALMRTAFPGASGDVTLIRVTVVGVVFLSVELLAARV